MTTPNLPIRYEVDSIGAASTGTLETICCSVVSEGGLERFGTLREVDRGKDLRSVPSGAFVPLVSVRLNSGALGASVIPVGVSVLSPSNSSFRWALIKDPTIAGSDNADWNQLTASVVDVDIERNSSNTVSNGIVLRSGYVPAGGLFGGESFAAESFQSALTLGSNVDGVSDELVLAVEHFESGAETFAAGITFRELK